MLRVPLAVVLLACSAKSCGCGEEEPAPPPAPTRIEVMVPRPIAAPTAFDLITTTSGAALVFSPPFTEGGGVRYLKLDRFGAIASEELTVFSEHVTDRPPTDCFEVRAAAGGGRVGIAWVERAAFSRTSYATLGPDSGEAFAPRMKLADLPVEMHPRGAIAVAASSDGTLDVMFRGRDVDCPPATARELATNGPCASVSLRRLDTGTSGREGVALAVPDPCREPLVGYVFSGGTWHYAVCSHASSRPVVTSYAISFDPEYARAEKTLEGCRPRGLSPLLDGVATAGRCGESEHAMLLRDSGREIAHGDTGSISVECRAGLPVIVYGTLFERELLGAVDRLEAILPEDVAPEGSRAVWTGETLLVATSLGSEVALRRYECRGPAPVRTDLL